MIVYTLYFSHIVADIYRKHMGLFTKSINPIMFVESNDLAMDLLQCINYD